MEKKKLKLNDLKVQSFVTELGKDNGQTLNVQGGIGGQAKFPGLEDLASHDTHATFCTCVTKPC